MTMQPAKSCPVEPLANGRTGRQLFEWAELRRVGIAVSMMVALGTAIIMVQAALMGYNSLAQAGPKAIVDGAVIAMLIGRTRRWRTLALLGPVYGLVLLMITGIAYLPPLMALAGAAGAMVGRAFDRVHRVPALIAGAVVFELLAGAGQPLHIYFGTEGGHEPVLWSMYFLEWPLRIGGAMLGVWIGLRFRSREVAPVGMSPAAGAAVKPSRRAAEAPLRIGVGTKLLIAGIGCIVPMFVQSWTGLAAFAAIYLAFTWLTGVRRALLWSLFGLVWIYLTYALASYLWHQDWARVIDLLRTVLLRFMPLTCAAAVIVLTVKPREMVRVLRRWRLSPLILIPLATALRMLAPAKRRVAAEYHALRASEHWRGPLTPIVRPVTVARVLFVPLFRDWANQLAER